jgi:hypothetical protein
LSGSVVALHDGARLVLATGQRPGCSRRRNGRRRASLAQEHPLKAVLNQGDLENAAAVTPVTIIEIWRLLAAARPRAILELGCGVSTVIFSYYASECARAGRPAPTVHSIRALAGMDRIVAQRLAALGLSSAMSRRSRRR